MVTPTTNRWRYRRQPRPVDPSDVGWNALAAGIVKQAVDDYRLANRHNDELRERQGGFCVWL